MQHSFKNKRTNGEPSNFGGKAVCPRTEMQKTEAAGDTTLKRLAKGLGKEIRIDFVTPKVQHRVTQAE